MCVCVQLYQTCRPGPSSLSQVEPTYVRTHTALSQLDQTRLLALCRPPFEKK